MSCSISIHFNVKDIPTKKKIRTNKKNFLEKTKKNTLPVCSNFRSLSVNFKNYLFFFLSEYKTSTSRKHHVLLGKKNIRKKSNGDRTIHEIKIMINNHH